MDSFLELDPLDLTFLFHSKNKIMIKKIIFFFFSVLLVASCTKDFAELNTNPTAVTDVPTSNLLSAAIQDLIGINSGLGANKTFMLYTQQWSQREETNRSRYNDKQRDWSSWYLNGMPELYNIIELNSGDSKGDYIAYGSNENQIAVAKILRAWAFHNITDAWGDVPYSDVGKPEITFPKYDSQASIYDGLLAELKDANNLIDVNAAGVKGDMVFNGDMAKWKKFANSLRARIALRMSKVNPDLGKSELIAALADGVMTSNDDNVTVDFQMEEKYSNPLFLEFKVQHWTYVSDVLVNAMSVDAANVDPRLMAYADPAINLGTIVGFPYGLTDAESSDIPQNDASHPSALVRSATFPSILFTYSELLFIQAEAVKLGWISGTAEDFYNDAIRASMAFWGVSEADANAHLAAAHVVFDDANWQEQMATQKWISLYLQGAQAWAEYRRSGYPVLQIPANSVLNNATEVPRRFFYPESEQSTNGDNLDRAIQAMGGDDFSVRVWWDKQ